MRRPCVAVCQRKAGWCQEWPCSRAARTAWCGRASSAWTASAASATARLERCFRTLGSCGRHARRPRLNGLLGGDGHEGLGCVCDERWINLGCRGAAHQQARAGRRRGRGPSRQRCTRRFQLRRGRPRQRDSRREMASGGEPVRAEERRSLTAATDLAIQREHSWRPGEHVSTANREASPYDAEGDRRDRGASCSRAGAGASQFRRSDCSHGLAEVGACVLPAGGWAVRRPSQLASNRRLGGQHCRRPQRKVAHPGRRHSRVTCMATITGSIEIDRPVEEVFGFVADERNEPRYNPDLLRSSKITDGPITVGTRFTAVHRSRGRPVEMTIEITECDRPHHFGCIPPCRELTYAACSVRAHWGPDPDALDVGGPAKPLGLAARSGTRCRDSARARVLDRFEAIPRTPAR